MRGAGSGLFMRRDGPGAKPGDVIALYGGEYFPPLPPEAAATAASPKFEDHGQYAIGLSGGGWVCGAAAARRAREDAANGRCAGWGAGAVANHPPRGVLPNVEAIAVDWKRQDGTTKSSEEETKATTTSTSEADDDDGDDDGRGRWWTVNPVTRAEWYVDRDSGSPVYVPRTLRHAARGAAFIATRYIEPGEEIYFNYRLNPLAQYPPWYAEVSDEQASWFSVEETLVTCLPPVDEAIVERQQQHHKLREDQEEKKKKNEDVDRRRWDRDIGGDWENGAMQ